MTVVLDIKGVSKRFGALNALKDVSLAVRKGERIALLGHNGAGKTTLFRLILGFLKPDSGRIGVDGGAPGSNAARAAISYLPENVAFPKKLTGLEIVGLYATLKKQPRRLGVDALARVGLAGAAKRPVGDYSKGMRQRLGLAVASLGAPRLILLDEPTSGLDPESRDEFYAFFRRLSEEGAAILFSSHTLSDINGNAERILLLKSGAVAAEGDEQKLRAVAGLPVRLIFNVGKAEAAAVAAEIEGAVNGDGTVEVECAACDKVKYLSRALAAGASIQDVGIHEPSLAEVVRALSHGGRRP